MKKEIGLWIDHKVAVIVNAADTGEIARIESDLAKDARFSGGAAKTTAEDIRDRRFANRLNSYYDEVINHIRDADAILIMGPGEAKSELKNRLETQNLDGRIVALESADKMTDPQVAAAVNRYFLKH